MGFYLSLIGRHRLAIVLMTLCVVGASVAVTFLQPFEYRSSFALLVIEKEGSLDGYAAAKSAERLSLSLSQIMYTASFADQVYQRAQQAGFGPDATLLIADEHDRRKEWKRHVETRVLQDVGMLKIAVYHPERDKATLLANALAVVLTEQGPEYLGGQNVQLRTVDFPLTSKRPARPNIPLNLSAGLLLGVAGAFAYVVLQHKLRMYGFVRERTPNAMTDAAPLPVWQTPAETPAQETQAMPMDETVAPPAYAQWETAQEQTTDTPADAAMRTDVPHVPQTPDNLPVVPESAAAEFSADQEARTYEEDGERLQHWYDTHPQSNEQDTAEDARMPSTQFRPAYAAEEMVWQMP